MKYYLIAGEASGDLHASHLMAAIKEEDAEARFRCFGGDMMAAEGAELVQHYRDLAYMGFIPVILHLRTILRGMKLCQKDILEWQPDALILVDYPGFNLKIARYIKQHSTIPVFYYIAPKIWAWKEYRIKDIKRDIDALLSILPFEKKFFEEKHHYPIHYVGNPTVDEVDAYLKGQEAKDRSWEAFRKDNNLDERPVIALLAGSRKQEVRNNLKRMILAAEPYTKDYQLVLAAAPGLDDAFYRNQIQAITGKPPQTSFKEQGARSKEQEDTNRYSEQGARSKEQEDTNCQNHSPAPCPLPLAPNESPHSEEEMLNGQCSMVNGQWSIVRGQTYRLLQHSTAALVTSGTATLETALFRIPQVVCYHMKWGRLASFARRLILKVPYISLVNLVADEEVVPELVAEQMTIENVRRHLAAILPGGPAREAQLQGYSRMADILGAPGAPKRAAKYLLQTLSKRK